MVADDLSQRLLSLTPESLLPPYPLKQVKVPIVENSLCDRKYHTVLYTGDNVLIVRDDVLCAGNNRSDSCQVGPGSPPTCTAPHPVSIWSTDSCLLQGDSGGPLVCKVKGAWLQALWSAGVRAVRTLTILASPPV